MFKVRNKQLTVDGVEGFWLIKETKIFGTQI